MRLQALPNGMLFDERAIYQLNAMLNAMREEGLSPLVISAYRSQAHQRQLFDTRVNNLMLSGLSYYSAQKEARRSIAYPGTSEHNMGLAVDITPAYQQILSESLENTPEIQWLIRHGAEFGFILRYPRGTEHITGIIFEPWHFRYVGVEAAQEIMERGITLEEYLGYVN